MGPDKIFVKFNPIFSHVLLSAILVNHQCQNYIMTHAKVLELTVVILSLTTNSDLLFRPAAF